MLVYHVLVANMSVKCCSPYSLCYIFSNKNIFLPFKFCYTPRTFFFILNESKTDHSQRVSFRGSVYLFCQERYSHQSLLFLWTHLSLRNHIVPTFLVCHQCSVYHIWWCFVVIFLLNCQLYVLLLLVFSCFLFSPPSS